MTVTPGPLRPGTKLFWVLLMRQVEPVSLMPSTSSQQGEGRRPHRSRTRGLLPHAASTRVWKGQLRGPSSQGQNGSGQLSQKKPRNAASEARHRVASSRWEPKGLSLGRMGKAPPLRSRASSEGAVTPGLDSHASSSSHSGIFTVASDPLERLFASLTVAPPLWTEPL